MNTLQKTTDKIGYDLMLKTQPGVIQAINDDLDAGGTAKQIERKLTRRFGRNCLTAQLAIGATYYIESQRKGTGQ